MISSLARAILLSFLGACVGCSSTGVEQPPVLPDGSFLADEQGEGASELARAVAKNGVPSPTPELDELAGSVSALTTQLSLAQILSEPRAAPGNLTLRPGDEVELIVFGREEFSRVSRVGADGNLEVFLLGPIPVAALTPFQAAVVIKRRLESSYLRDPSVSLLIRERVTSTAKVVGRVQSPGSVDLPSERRLSLIGLLTRAGGLLDDADGSRLTFVRKSQGLQRAYHFSLQQLLKAHLKGRDVWVEPDDELVVPRLPSVFVYGEVAKPGPYPLRPESTIASVLFKAEGLTEDADSRALIAMSGKSASRPVTLESTLAPGEVLFVPRRQRVYLVGAGVVKNGPLDLPRSGLTVVQAIAEAGWFTGRAKLDEVEILRQVAGKQQRIQVPISEILDGERSGAEFRLQPGDLVFVPESIW